MWRRRSPSVLAHTRSSRSSASALLSLVNDWREDSDLVRVRVRGEFPRAGNLQFIDSQRVEGVVRRELIDKQVSPLAMGVDIARQGPQRRMVAVDAHSFGGLARPKLPGRRRRWTPALTFGAWRDGSAQSR
jgi:hypothetical protein